MKIEGDNVIFSTGTIKSANQGIIGLAPDMDVTEGYDESFFMPECPSLSPQECVELAEYMIARWQEFADKYKN